MSQLATIKCKLHNAQYCTKCVQKIIIYATTFSIKGPFNNYVTLFLVNFYPSRPCHKLSGSADPLHNYVKPNDPPTNPSNSV